MCDLDLINQLIKQINKLFNDFKLIGIGSYTMFCSDYVQPKAESASVVTVFDVANYILEKLGTMTAMKLQKLVYYAQAWSLVWDENPLFLERIEAWAHGPVVPELYYQHKGQFRVSCFSLGNSSKLNDSQKDTINQVLEFYGDKSSQWLSDLTHSEDPWLNARKGLSSTCRGNQEIDIASMMEYYSSL